VTAPGTQTRAGEWFDALAVDTPQHRLVLTRVAPDAVELTEFWSAEGHRGTGWFKTVLTALCHEADDRGETLCVTLPARPSHPNAGGRLRRLMISRRFRVNNARTTAHPRPDIHAGMVRAPFPAPPRKEDPAR